MRILKILGLLIWSLVTVGVLLFSVVLAQEAEKQKIENRVLQLKCEQEIDSLNRVLDQKEELINKLQSGNIEESN